ncbi:MAG: sodium-dependent transporter [Burkholderiales bacterium]
MAENSGSSIISIEHWSSRLAFVLAASGSAVGLGNIWKFPYITGQYGGGAFVIVYLLCVLLVGLPILMAEVVMGRHGGLNPVGTMRRLAKESGASPAWQVAGWAGVAAAFLILSFYSVVGGWALAYVFYALRGLFSGSDALQIESIFNSLLANPGVLVSWHTAFIAATIFIVAGGVKRGLERSVSWMMPLLFLLIVFLVLYSALFSGAFLQAVDFMFRPDWSKLTWDAVLVALGHAFFTLSLGMGAMMVYGHYLQKDVSVPETVYTVAALDTVIALLAGLAIFPLVFAHGIEPGGGPGLVFVSLPIAFGSLPLGVLLGTAFFILLTVAALTSAISILEPAVSYITERHGVARRTAAIVTGLAAWLLGVACALSFNLWSEFKIAGRTVFDTLDFLTANVMLPLGGLAIALFAGWVMMQSATRDEFGDAVKQYKWWRVAVRYVAPAAIIIVFLHSLGIL